MKRSYLLLLLLFLYVNVVSGQEKVVRGTVKSGVEKKALAGVLVYSKATFKSTITDSTGYFQLSVPEISWLELSLPGYITAIISSGTGQDLTVELRLSDLTATGYGTTEKSHLTGAIAKESEFNNGLIYSPEQLIQGRLDGAQISRTSGEPGSGINTYIRGISSVTGNAPLFVVDGFPLSDHNVYAESANLGIGTSSPQNSLNFLNPEDVESICILKDASSAAIYGARGANGVVLINTKNGEGKNKQLEYASSISISRVSEQYELLNAGQYLEELAALGADRENFDRGAQTDWQNEIFRDAISHDHQLSYAHNYQSGFYRASLGYSNIRGIVKNSDFERFTGHLRLKQYLFKGKLIAGAGYSFSALANEAVPITDNAGFTGDLLGTAYMANPTWPADPEFQSGPMVVNPLSLLKYTSDNSSTGRNMINLTLDYSPAYGLNLMMRTGFDHSVSARRSAYSPDFYFINGVYTNGRGYINKAETGSKLLETWLTYDHHFKTSSLTALAGYGYQQFSRNGSMLQGWGFKDPDTEHMTEDLAETAEDLRKMAPMFYQQFGYSQGSFFANSLYPVPTTITAENLPPHRVKAVTESLFKGSEELQSFFGRLHYNLRNRYFFTSNLRLDGSTKFAPKYRYGFFPSAALAWDLSGEHFTPDFFEELKLRAGFGITGNHNIPPDSYKTTGQFLPAIINNEGNVYNPGLSQTGYNNPELKWEQTRELNFGIDFIFGQGKWSGSFDLYRKLTSDLFLLIVAPQPASGPLTGKNADGQLVNNGAELSLHYQALRTKKTTLGFGLNGAYNTNKLKNFTGTINAAEIHGQGLSGSFSQRIVADQPLYTYYLREFTGFDENGLSTYKEDRPALLKGKTPLPKYNIGFTGTFSHLNWDLTALFYGQFGHYIYHNTANAFFTRGSLANGRNVTSSIRERSESPVNAPEVSTRFLEKGDFLRIQNLQLGYNIRQGKKFIKTIRLSATAQNLFTLTKYSGLNPEVNTNKPLNGIPSLGIDYTSYPTATTFTIGLDAGF